MICALLSVLEESVFQAGVRQRVDGLWVPSHDLVLLQKFDVLGGSVGSHSAQAVELLGGSLSWSTSAGKYEVNEEVPQAILEI